MAVYGCCSFSAWLLGSPQAVLGALFPARVSPDVFGCFLGTSYHCDNLHGAVQMRLHTLHCFQSLALPLLAVSCSGGLSCSDTSPYRSPTASRFSGYPSAWVSCSDHWAVCPYTKRLSHWRNISGSLIDYHGILYEQPQNHTFLNFFSQYMRIQNTCNHNILWLSLYGQNLKL